MNEQVKEIGMRLASLRDDMGYTQEEMAEKLNEDLETYKKQEKGELDFSFSFIYNAAEVLGVDVLELITGSQPTLSMCTVVRKGDGYSVTRPHGYDYKHLAYTFKDKKSEPFYVTINKSDKPPVLHGHEGQEFNYILKGKMKFYIGDISYELDEGDSVYFDSTYPHAEESMTDVTEFIAIVIK